MPEIAVTARITGSGATTQEGVAPFIVKYQMSGQVGGQPQSEEIFFLCDPLLTDTEIEASVRSQLADYLTAFGNQTFLAADIRGGKI